MDSRTHTRDARTAVLSHLEEGNSERTALIDTIVEETDADRAFIEDVVDQLKASGEIYIVNGEVRRTP